MLTLNIQRGVYEQTVKTQISNAPKVFSELTRQPDTLLTSQMDLLKILAK